MLSQILSKLEGELRNEEGLPIIDITEPVTAADAQDGLVMEETILPSIAALTPEVRERWRQERDSILDQLEEEERREQVREQHGNFEQKQETLRKVKEEAAKETLRLQSVKEIQKKMGKALVRNLAKANEEVSEPHEIQLSDNEQRLKESRPKKAVTFTEPDDKSTLSSPSIDWGDVAPGRLRSKGPALMARQHPMKDVVLERVPTAPLQTDHLSDSDGESDDEQINEVHGIYDEETRSNMDDDSVSEDLEEEEYDLDSARHHREIALEYYAKRDKIGEAAMAAMSSHSHVKDKDVELDLDVPIFPQHKPAMSQFKASRLASAYNATSKSFGTSATPPATARKIQKEIRTGRLDANDRLVGGNDDSESELEDEGMQEVLDLLRKGELYNIGPSGSSILTVTPPASKQVATHRTPVSTSQPDRERLHFDDLPAVKRPATSRFKASRPTVGHPTVSDSSSKPRTSNHVSEGMTSRMPPTMSSHVLERRLPPNAPPKPLSSFSTSNSFPGAEAEKVSPKRDPLPTVIEPPSFAKPLTSKSQVTESSHNRSS